LKFELVRSKSHSLVIQICNSSRGLSLQQFERDAFAPNVAQGKIGRVLSAAVEVLMVHLNIESRLQATHRLYGRLQSDNYFIPVVFGAFERDFRIDDLSSRDIQEVDCKMIRGNGALSKSKDFGAQVDSYQLEIASADPMGARC
jgi:hypothetical protein